VSNKPLHKFVASFHLSLKWKKWLGMLLLAVIMIVPFHFIRIYYLPDRFRMQGENYTQEQNFEKAIQSFKKAIWLNPRSPNAYIALARTYIHLNKPSSAVDELLRASKFNPEDENILNLLKKAYQMELIHSSQTLKIGVQLGLAPLTTLQAMQLLLNYLSQNLNQKISLTIIAEYGSVANSLAQRKIDMAIMEPEELTKIENRSEIIPLGLISFYKQGIQQRIVILTADELIQTVKDLKGKKVAFGDKDSLTGYILPRVLLLKHGIDPDKDLKEMYFMESQERILTNIVEGKVDAGVLNEQAFRYLSSIEHPPKKVHIIACSSEIPADVLGVNRNMAPELINKIKTILVKYARRSPDNLTFSLFNEGAFCKYADFDGDEIERERKRVYTATFAQF